MLSLHQATFTVCDSLQEEVRDLQQDRLVLFDVQSDKNHVMRHPHQLQAILLPLRTACESERIARESLKTIVEENSKWIQLYEVRCCHTKLKIVFF